MNWTDILDSLENLPEGVYVNVTYGVPGTAWPIGTPFDPVSNLADARAIAIARKTRNIIILETNTAILDADVDPACDPFRFIGGSEIFDSFNLNGKKAPGCVFSNLYMIGSSPLTTGAISFVDCWLNSQSVLKGLVVVRGKVSGAIVCDHATIEDSDLNSPSFDFTTSSRLVGVKGECSIINFITGGETIEIYGNGLKLTIAASCTLGTIKVYGDVKIINSSGGTVVNDFTNKPNTEVAVNITAVNTGETDFLNLATASKHYTIDDLVLKCDDPGLNTVTVRLYKLVNGGSVLIHSFDITTAGALVRGVSSGFANYLGLDDMFTRTQLAGDNIKITVRASAGGPYIVTGSYSVRNA